MVKLHYSRISYLYSTYRNNIQKNLLYKKNSVQVKSRIFRSICFLSNKLLALITLLKAELENAQLPRPPLVVAGKGWVCSPRTSLN